MSESTTTAKENWDRYQYGAGRGHDMYVWRAARLEGFYLGGDIDGDGKLMPGGQWNEDDLKILDDQRRPAYEFNETRPSVNSAIGYQIHNRMDIAFQPAGGEADHEIAKVRSKLAMHIMRTNKFHYKETQVFSDGLIEQRGYFNVALTFKNNMMGDAFIEVLDPRDVIPDPDAKSYDPEGWADFLITRWLTLDEIEERYGEAKRNEVEGTAYTDERDFGEEDLTGERNKFGETDMSLSGWSIVGGERRCRVVERQKWKREVAYVAVHAMTGDFEAVDMKQTDKIAQLRKQGFYLTKKRMARVWWTVSTERVMLFDDWSPFPWFTIVPYFPYFRRGKTRGMVDIAIGPQMVLNKGVSQYIHIVNTTANSGWQVEEDSLTNMTTEELEDVGASTGLVQEYKKGSTPPKKIEPNNVPPGVDKMIDRATVTLKEVTVPEAMRGENSQEVSGVAIQSRQFASQQQLAVPLDNLGHTRHMVADRLNWIISNFYDSERVLRITETDPVTGEEMSEEITINQFVGGKYMNDMTVGKYDLVVTEQPMQVTFENSQFTQALEIRKAGINVPDWAVIKHSNLADKQEILSEMGQGQADPATDAKVQLLQAQAEKTRAETVNKNVEAMFGGVQAGQTIAAIPAVAPLADALLKSAGFQDKDGGTLAPVGSPDMAAQEFGTAIQGRPPMIQGDQAAAINRNTDPRFPANPENPAVGINKGIETQESDSVITK